jgi:hypothetical protein
MAMPVLLGVILGVILTVAGAFAYDTSTGRAQNGLSPSTAANPPMVNWDVVNDDWQGFKANVRQMGADFERGLKKLTG